MYVRNIASQPHPPIAIRPTQNTTTGRTTWCFGQAALLMAEIKEKNRRAQRARLPNTDLPMRPPMRPAPPIAEKNVAQVGRHEQTKTAPQHASGSEITMIRERDGVRRIPEQPEQDLVVTESAMDTEQPAGCVHPSKDTDAPASTGKSSAPHPQRPHAGVEPRGLPPVSNRHSSTATARVRLIRCRP